MLTTDYDYWQWFARFTVLFFFVFGLVALAVSVGLIANSTRTSEIAGTLNRWTSTRRALKWMSVPRDGERALHRHTRVFGALLIAGSAFVLAAGPDTRGVFAGFNLSRAGAEWLTDAANWSLLAGNAAAIVVGVLFLCFPQSVAAVEARANRWISTRAIATRGDAMHMALDNQVMRNPRLAGWLIMAGALFVVIDFGLLLFKF
jgi:hypothetical protein